MIPLITVTPSRDDPANFANEANTAWEQLVATVAGINAELAGIDSAVSTVAAGLSAPKWTAATYNLGDLRRSTVDGFIYICLTNAYASTVDPHDDGGHWLLSALPDWPLVVPSGTTHTATDRTRVRMTNAAVCYVDLPASTPAVGWSARIGYFNGRIDNVLRRPSGTPLMGKDEDMTINIPYWARYVEYIGGSKGYVVTK